MNRRSLLHAAAAALLVPAGVVSAQFARKPSPAMKSVEELQRT